MPIQLLQSCNIVWNVLSDNTSRPKTFSVPRSLCALGKVSTPWPLSRCYWSKEFARNNAPSLLGTRLFIKSLAFLSSWKEEKHPTSKDEIKCTEFFKMFHLPCIHRIHNIQITNKMHCNVYDVFYSQCSHQHVSAATSVCYYYRNTKIQMWLAVTSSLHSN